MINIENDIADTVASVLRSEYPKIYISNEYVLAPSSFPAVTIVEADNYVFTSMRTVNIENAVQVMYEINVFSNKTKGKKEEAKTIMGMIDETLTTLGFTRITSTQVPNLNDSTIYRLVNRYSAIVGPDNDDGYFIYQSI